MSFMQTAAWLRLLRNALLGTGVLASHAAHGDLVTMPRGLNPGEHFRVIFATSATHDALSGDMAVYDAFVRSVAAAAGLDSYFGQAVSWQTLGSTQAVNAIDRVALDSPGLYGMFGERIADDGADLWDGSIDNAVLGDEHGFIDSRVVFTGTGSDGSRTDNPLGGGAVQLTEVGFANLLTTNGRWVHVGADGGNRLHSFYAVSSVLTVPAPSAVPEPGSGMLAALALAAGIAVTGIGRKTTRTAP